MTQGMFSAISGIAANQTKLDVIADNIANVNTVAFKSTQVNFQTVFSRTLSAGQAPTGSLGGTNPKQIGLGVQIGEMGRNFNQGNIQSTGRNTDLNIQGEGFFALENGGAAVGPAAGVLLTRAGNFTLDANGNLVNPNGLRVLGTTNITSESTNSNQYVYVPRRMNIVKTYDALGNATSATITTASVDGNAAANPTYDYSLTTFNVSSDGAIEASYSNGDRITVRTNAAGTARELLFFPSEGGSGFTVGAGLVVNNNVVEPYNMQIQFATVTNNAGLVAVGSNLWSSSVNSGRPFFSIARTSGVGLIASGGLESSNVDLTQEFSQMMLSQRALEANSRSFDTHNSILQTIVNLAR